MDGNKTLKMLLDNLFDTLGLKSWTLHENNSGTTVTLRFPAARESTDSDISPSTTTYKRKSRYQTNRDRTRLESFNVRCKTRSQAKLEENAPETERRGDDPSESFNPPDLSPIRGLSVASVDSVSSDLLESPIADGSWIMDDGVTTALAESACVQEVDHSTRFNSENDSASADTKSELNFDDNIKAQDRSYDDIFYEHLSKHSDIDVDNIVCNESDCPVRAKCVGVKIRYFRIIYCDKCNLYICSKCRFGPNSYKTDIEPGFTHSSTCNNPSFFIS